MRGLLGNLGLDTPEPKIFSLGVPVAVSSLLGVLRLLLGGSGVVISGV